MLRLITCTILLVVLILASCATWPLVPAAAQPIRSMHPSAQVAYNDNHDNHVRHRDVVRIVSVAQINPAYLSAYNPEGYDTATQAQILAEIQQLTARVNTLQTQLSIKTPAIAPVVIVPPAKPGDPAVVVPPVVVPPVTPTPGLAAALNILQTHCAACHQTGKLLPDQKFTLLDAGGNLVTLTDKQKLRVIQKTRTSQMPPPSNTFGIPSLTDVEFSAVADLMGQ